NRKKTIAFWDSLFQGHRYLNKMFRSVSTRLGSTLFKVAKQSSQKTTPAVRNFGVKEYANFDEAFDKNMLDCVNNKDIDGVFHELLN
ncbi:hypothetical protein KUTeg_018380, partial [Tegillarca granosa]